MTDSKSVVAQATRGSNPRLSAIIIKGLAIIGWPFLFIDNVWATLGATFCWGVLVIS